MRARSVAFIDSLGGNLVSIRPGVLRDVQTGSVVGPIHQAVLEYGIGSRDALWNRQGITYFARHHGVGDIDDPQPVAIPGREDQVLEDRGVVILLRDGAPARDSVRQA